MKILKEQGKPCITIDKCPAWEYRDIIQVRVNDEVKFITDCREIVEDFHHQIKDKFNLNGCNLSLVSNGEDYYKYPKFTGYDLSAIINTDKHEGLIKQLFSVNFDCKNMFEFDTPWVDYNSEIAIAKTYGVSFYLNKNTDSMDSIINLFYEMLVKEFENKFIALRKFPYLTRDLDDYGHCKWTISCRIAILPDAKNYNKNGKRICGLHY